MLYATDMRASQQDPLEDEHQDHLPEYPTSESRKLSPQFAEQRRFHEAWVSNRAYTCTRRANTHIEMRYAYPER
jgi:hypothetical protein